MNDPSTRADRDHVEQLAFKCLDVLIAIHLCAEATADLDLCKAESEATHAWALADEIRAEGGWNVLLQVLEEVHLKPNSGKA